MTEELASPDFSAGEAGEGSSPSVEAELREVQACLGDTLLALREAEEQVRAGRQREARLEVELQHRVKNMLAVVRSIFSRSVATRDSVKDLADHFRGRLDALARYHTGAAGLRRLRFDVEGMVFDELLQCRADSDPRIQVAGPDVFLGGSLAESLGLALHELVTNSIKFGVLAQPPGRGQLRIEWRISAGRLVFTWRETGMAIIGSAPLRSGFGHEFIEQSLPYQHDAQTIFNLEAGMLTCVIDVALEDGDYLTGL